MQKAPHNSKQTPMTTDMNTDMTTGTTTGTSRTSDVKTRLLLYLKHKRLSQREFTELLGVSQAYIGAMRRQPSPEKIERMRALFPDLNTDWLLYGDGNMLRDTEERPQADMIPLLPVEAFAGTLQDFSQGVGISDCEMIASPIRGAQYAIRVSGDSMEPKIHDGSTLIIRRINEQAFIPWGHSMVIDTENGVLIKEVFPDDTQATCIEARSINPKYPPIHIPRESIYGLYRILGIVTLTPTF